MGRGNNRRCESAHPFGVCGTDEKIHRLLAVAQPSRRFHYLVLVVLLNLSEIEDFASFPIDPYLRNGRFLIGASLCKTLGSDYGNE